MDPTTLVPGAVTAIITTELIQIAKTSGWKALGWINVDSQNVNRIVGGTVAFLTGLGLSWHFDAATGQLIVNGLLWGSVSHAAVQWAQMQMYYRLVVKTAPAVAPAAPVAPPVVPPVVGG